MSTLTVAQYVNVLYSGVLNPYEEAVAETLGKARDANSRARRAVPAFGAPANDDKADTLTPNIVGVKGELFVARIADLYPNMSSYEEEKAAGGYDLSHHICVRSAQKRYGLLVRPSDPLDGRFVAVVVKRNDITILGWEYGLYAKNGPWLSAPHDREPCFLVPERYLRPFSSLLSLIAGER
jgi:hypothetical protein